MEERIERIHTAADFLLERLGDRHPVVGIVLGSGLGNLADSIADPLVVPYRTIPGFPLSTATGHKGNFIVGTLGGKTVMAMQGRFHYYEGYPMEITTIGVRTMAKLGVKTLFVSNAAGACNSSYEVGDMMIIQDHISLLPNPLIGPNMEEFGPRFLDMTCPYNLKLIAKAEQIATQMGLTVHKGVYLGSTGPTYETPAEVRFYRTIGADVLGMSTIPEVIVARHCGMDVFGMSVITNKANTENAERNLNDGDDVVVQADRAADSLCELFARLIESI